MKPMRNGINVWELFQHDEYFNLIRKDTIMHDGYCDYFTSESSSVSSKKPKVKDATGKTFTVLLYCIDENGNKMVVYSDNDVNYVMNRTAFWDKFELLTGGL